MIDKTIFTLDDIREVKKISVNIDDVEQYARLAQMNYLQKILGDKLYTALLADLDGAGVPQTARFTELVEGVVYTNGHDIIFRGVKLYCVYLWLHLYLADSAVSITPIGGRLFKDENADFNEAKKSYRNSEAHFIGAADGLEEPILRFLSFNQATYPEFSESYKIEQAEADNITLKVLGNSFVPPNNFI